ncbi:NAD(P)/FAD-dependent oxidoreductase [Microvirga massiliensis]|uniref:NAD(P)/FAD-dependent oxidoreductase n=1 Tax=Microvirga massiliensis TaxID=1033741 RepID=UPI00062BB1A2|nr:FAD-binding oxidoreductase [Microvirga massiliensis]
MIRQPDAVVIGSGGLGASTAFHLAQRGRRVALLDRHDIGSQTSPRAAGMVNCVRKSDLMITLIKIACEKIRRFSADTGQPLDWVHSGSLKVARRPQDTEVIAGDVARGRRMGLDVAQISPEEASRLNPFLRPDGICAVMRVGDDMYFDPSQVAVGFARSAADHGAILLPHTRVTRVLIDQGQVTGVATDRGTILAPVVVDAAGAWTREIAEASGLRVPLVPTGQQLFITEPVEGARPDLPMVRIMDAAVYLRPCDGGFLWGVYEEKPRFFEMQALGLGFHMKDMPLDAQVLWRAAEDVRVQLPVLLQAGVREHRGGIPTMTADGQHILGPAPGIDGFYFASGCNVAGLSISPALGELLAAWIVEGEPPIDLTPLSVARFGDSSWTEEQLRNDAAWQYRHFYGAA